MKRISIYFIMLVAAFSLSIGVQAKTITVTTAGTLTSYLSSEETQTVTELIISGPLNGTDIALIRTTAGNLEKLDLTNATIVEGGTPYTSYNGQDYMTQNNIVGSYMFRGMVNLIDLKFPKNVVGLGSYTKDGYYSTWSGYSVSNCPSLETVTLPSTLLWIGEYSFDACSRLKEIIIPEGVKIMGQYTFNGCQSLKKASLPSTLTDSFTYDGCTFASQYNSGRNFADCTNLEEVILPEGLTLLYSYMFSGATSIKHITLPTTLKVINSAFNGCSGLLELELPNGLTQLGNMYGCSSLKSLVIPESVTEVGSFGSCTQLESITLPSGLAGRLPDFNGCSNLKSITIPDNVIGIDRRNFIGCTQLTKITIPGTITSFYSSVFANSGLTEVTINNGIREIGENAFENTPLTSITFPKTITRISGLGNSNITNIHFAEGAEPTEIAENAFYGCKIATFNIPASVTTIKEGAFQYSSIQEITIPETVTTIEDRCFNNCNELTKVTLPTNMTELPNSMFWSCSKLKTIQLPSKLEKIGSHAFRDSGINAMQLPQNLKVIEYWAFNGCTQLKSITLPPHLEKIGERAFESTSINNIEIPATVTEIGERAFRCYNSSEGSYKSYLNTVVWNPSWEVPYNVFSAATYLYIPENGSVASNAEYNFTYIFRGGVTDQMEIKTDGNQFSIAKELKAKKVYYYKNFNTESGYNSPAGWKTIVLPFDVDQFTYTRYSTEPDATGTPLAPFGNPLLETDDMALPFWLYELTPTGYVSATSIQANKPYLICMPNNRAYPEANNITGNVRFSAENGAGVLLVPTEGALQSSEGANYSLVPTYATVEKSEQVYSLNETSSYFDGNKDYPAGSVFIRNYADVAPFQAYVQTKAAPASAPRLYSIGGDGGNITGIGSMILTPDQATRAYSENGILYIESNAVRTIPIYDASGRTIRVIEAQEGRNEVNGLAEGIYFLEGQKVMVKK